MKAPYTDGGMVCKILANAAQSPAWAEIAAVQEILGENIPVAGGYTLGQVISVDAAAPKFLNQHIVVIVFGESVRK